MEGLGCLKEMQILKDTIKTVKLLLSTEKTQEYLQDPNPPLSAKERFVDPTRVNLHSSGVHQLASELRALVTLHHCWPSRPSNLGGHSFIA
jgi:hypothetical protein